MHLYLQANSLEVPMNMLIRFLAAAVLAALMAFPSLCLAEEPGDNEAGARFSEHPPPVIPHPAGDDVNAEACLACHRAGLKGAPITPHPARLNCTQCHVPGGSGESLPAGNKGKAR
jgi:cytochrome c-type protein NapB